MEPQRATHTPPRSPDTDTERQRELLQSERAGHSPPPSPERLQSERLAKARLSRIRQHPASPRTLGVSSLTESLAEAERELQVLLHKRLELKEASVRLDSDACLRGSLPREQQCFADTKFAVSEKFVTPSLVSAVPPTESPIYPSRWHPLGPLPETMPKPPTPTYTPGSAVAPAEARRTSPPPLPTGADMTPLTQPTVLQMSLPGGESETPTESAPYSSMAEETEQMRDATRLAQQLEAAAIATQAHLANFAQSHQTHMNTSAAAEHAIQEDHEARMSIELSIRASLQEQLELAAENIRMLERKSGESEAAAAQMERKLEAANARLSATESDLRLCQSEVASKTAEAKASLAQALMLEEACARSQRAEEQVRTALEAQLQRARADAAHELEGEQATAKRTAERLATVRHELEHCRAESESVLAASEAAAAQALEDELEKAYASSQEALEASQADADTRLSVAVSMREALQEQLSVALGDAAASEKEVLYLGEQLERVQAQLVRSEEELKTVSQAAHKVQAAAEQAGCQLVQLEFARSRSDEALQASREDADRRLSIEMSKVAKLRIDAEHYRKALEQERCQSKAIAEERDAVRNQAEALGAAQSLQIKQARAEMDVLAIQLQQSLHNSGAAKKQSAAELDAGRSRLSRLETELSTLEAALVTEKKSAAEANARFAEHTQSLLSENNRMMAELHRDLEKARGEAAHAVAQRDAARRESMAELSAVRSQLSLSESAEQLLTLQVEHMESEMADEQMLESEEQQQQLLRESEARVQRQDPHLRDIEPPTPSLLVEMRKLDARYAPNAAASPADSVVPYQGSPPMSPSMSDPPTPSSLADLRKLDTRHDTGPSPVSQQSCLQQSTNWSQMLEPSVVRTRSATKLQGSHKATLGKLDFVTLQERPELAGEVAAWLFAEWGHLSSDHENSSEKLRGRLLAKVRDSTESDLPVVVVALEVLSKAGQLNKPVDTTTVAIPVGTATLKLQELQEHFPNVQNWLGSVVVRPSSRGRGVGAALVAEMERRAAQRGLTQLHLATEALDGGLYARLGWEAVPPIIIDRGDQVLVMRKRLIGIELGRLSSTGARHTPTRLRSRLALPEPIPEPVLPHAEPHPQPQARSESQSRSPEMQLEAQSELQPEPEPEPEPEPQPRSRPEPQPQPQPQPEAPQSEPDPALEIQQELGPQSRPQSTSPVCEELSPPLLSTPDSDVTAAASLATSQTSVQSTFLVGNSELHQPQQDCRYLQTLSHHHAEHQRPWDSELQQLPVPERQRGREALRHIGTIPRRQCLRCGGPSNRISEGGHRTEIGLFCSAVCAAKEEALRLHGTFEYATAKTRAGHPTVTLSGFEDFEYPPQLNKSLYVAAQLSVISIMRL